MESSRDKLIGILEKIVEKHHFSEIRFLENCQGTIKQNSRFGYMLPCNRITHVLNGTLQLRIVRGFTYTSEEYSAGTTLVIKPFAITGGIWDKCHETIGLVSRSEYMRVFHSIHDRPGISLMEPTEYYHLKDSLRLCTIHAVNLLCELQKNEEGKRLGASILNVVFLMLLEDLKNSTETEYGRARELWTRITDHLANSLIEEQSRKEVADHFHVTETYISKLFTRFSQMTFKEYLRTERLKNAVKLLDETNMTIDEIAWNCGFQSSNYFIRSFKAQYKVSPGCHRRLRK